MTGHKKQLVILVSGSGSNLQTFIDQCASGALPATIACVISNQPSALGLERARAAGIATQLINHREYSSRELFDQALASSIQAHDPDLVILAGFMRILTTGFVQAFEGRLINIHPSLLPKYTGLHTHQRAIAAGEREAGATVHFVTAELDGGPAIVQAKVAIVASDTAESLAARVLAQEHKIFPLAAKWFLENRLQLQDGKVYLDQQQLSVHGYPYED